MSSYNHDLSQEEREFAKGIREILAKQNPNPGRVGCSTFVKDLHNFAWHRPLHNGLKNLLDHVCHCSECFTEHQQHKARYKRYLFIRQCALAAVAVLVVVAGLVLGFTLRKDISQPPQDYREIVMDLRQARSRSSGEVKGPQELLLPRERVLLTIVLPAGNESGDYEVQLSRDRTMPLVSAKGKAIMNRELLLVSVKMDCRALAPGRYSVGIRELGWDWTDFPVQVQ
ncbi:MAG: hypothetical protein AB1898_30210 [Acidobacteriota bacterium]